jgi:DNA repair protein RecN (Recombination protein N)
LLKHLHIRDFAVIEELEIQFNTGMTVFTGETGAGKSIIVDALGLVLGDRADSSIIRSQCDSTEITAIFEINDDQAVREILDEQGINQNGELMLRRVINKDGRSRAYVNGSSVPVQILRDLGESMVDIHGQHAHQSLLKREVQRQLLDGYGKYEKLLEQVRSFWNVWSAANTELTRISGHDQDRDARLALLQYQVQELEALNPDSAEIKGLEEEHTRLANASKILESCQQLLNRLTEDDQSIINQLNHGAHELASLLRFDQSLTSVSELLENANIQINEAATELRHYLDNLELDPARLRTVEERITALHDIARKHKVKPEGLAAHLELLKSELKNLEDSEQHLADLEKKREQALQSYRKAAMELHTQRKKAAAKLGKGIEAKLKELGMPGGRFEIDIQTLEKETPQREGTDRIEYLVSVNPGQLLQPLNKVASGGELSRISLAIQVIGSKDKGLPTLIFDEVDSGIGGGVAEIVGNLLHSLANNRQVFCVTHLPQVASQGNHHLQVNKSTLALTTLTQVITLNEDERVEEIARMLGGLKITEQTRAHAKEMLKAVTSDKL